MPRKTEQWIFSKEEIIDLFQRKVPVGKVVKDVIFDNDFSVIVEVEDAQQG